MSGPDVTTNAHDAGPTGSPPVGPADWRADRAVEDVVRTSYGRLVAFLAATTGDIAAAEDALADAFEAALRTWPTRGVPDRPVSWMLTAARRSLIGRHRRREVAARAAPTLAILADEATSRADAGTIPDKRLELLFVCAHPAIDPSLHAPLMLQTVFGLDAQRMGVVFLVPGATLGQRLVRAKRKIKDAGIPFAVPSESELPERTGAVLEAVYAAYGSGWDDPLGADPSRRGLTAEALRLVGLLADLRPDDPEVLGLAALLHHVEARAAARRADDGAFVALVDQDQRRWSPVHLARGEELLTAALRLDRLGPFQLQAAVQSVHNRRIVSGVTDWAAIAALYDRLVEYQPTTGVVVARAAARLEADGPVAAAQALEAADAERRDRYQPYWVVAAEIADRRGDRVAMSDAARSAIALTTDPAVRAYLADRFGVDPSPDGS